MYSYYERAVSEGLDAYRVFGYPETSRSIFRISTTELLIYLKDHNAAYSQEIVTEWLESSTADRTRVKTVRYKRAMRVLEDIMQHGRVTTSLTEESDRTRKIQLDGWCGSALENYLGQLNVGSDRLNEQRRYCARFLRYVCDNGINGPSGICIETVCAFLTGKSHYPEGRMVTCRRIVAAFIEYLAVNEMLPRDAWQKIKPIVRFNYNAPNIIENSERTRILDAVNEPEIYPIYVFQEAAAKFLQHQQQSGYSESKIGENRQAINEFTDFMLSNELPYSVAIAEAWQNKNRTGWSANKCWSFNRTVQCVEQMRCGVDPKSSYIRQKRSATIPEWSKGRLNEYIASRENEHLAKSTVDMIRDSVARLAWYLERAGKHGWEQLTAESIKAFHVQDSHRTPQGRNAYSSKIRMFLSFLSDRGDVADTLPLAVPVSSAPRRRIIEILSDEEIKSVYQFRSTATDAIELKWTAIVLLGITLGLRASDIANLKLSDIHWPEAAISIIQQKTGQRLKLPFSIQTGNSLWRYINEGRPKQADAQLVFVRHSAPYCGMSANTMRLALKKAVMATDEDTGGFHIARRTFASKLLSAGNSAETIAAGIGHRNTKSADPYLATDTAHMKMCPIGLSGIGYEGGMI